ncbi:MAG TPA: putative Ig domain-containing protein [Actinokineospora sp.]|nr:putative Ig domain-containing protein [Actinokineospora sp.]
MRRLLARSRTTALLAAGAVALGTVVAVLPGVSTAQATVDTFDDSDLAITYGGGSWLDVDPGGCYNRTCHNANAAGRTATFTFKGASITWRGVKGADQGIASVSIDGGPATTVNLYAATRSVDVPVYTSPVLPIGTANGEHTITITTQNSAWVTIDRFITVPLAETLIDDAHPSATYTGFTSSNPGGCWSGTCHNAATAGATATVPFTGTSVSWYSITDSNQGEADVYIDGVLDGAVNLYAATRTVTKSVYTKSGLPAGNHRFQIVTKNTKPVTLDAVQVAVTNLEGPLGTNLVVNPGFETGTLAGYTNSGAAISTTAVTGQYAAKLTAGVAGSVSQTLTRLVPGADYVATAIGRTTDAASGVYLTVAQPGSTEQSALAPSTVAWVPLAIPFRATGTQATVKCAKPGTAGEGLCDDLRVHRADQIAIADPGFESGSLASWPLSTASTVDSTTANSGTRSAKVGSAGVAGSVAQKISGLRPSTNYLATVRPRTGSGATVNFVAAQFGGADVSWPTQRDWFARAQVSFATGPNATSAVLSCTKAATGEAWCDDFVLWELKPDGTDPITGTVKVDAGYLTVGMDSAGTVVDLIDNRTGTDRIAPGKAASLVSLVVNGAQQRPTSVTRAGDLLTFTNASGIAVDVRLVGKSGYTTFEVTRAVAAAGADVQAVLWGPLATSIVHTVGEAIGIVRDGTFAMGLKPLNDRTEGTWPRDFPQWGWQADINRNPYSLQNTSIEEDAVAAKTSWGSVLRAFKFDYTKERVRANLTGGQIPVGPLTTDATVVGSKVALYGSAPALVMTTLSYIAQAEGRPYPTQDGQWQRTAQASSQSLLVYSDLNTNNVDQGATFANAAGIGNMYSLPNSVGPWQTTGHYQFSSQFGSSDAAAKTLVDKAEAKGVHIGVHTISDFISTSDSYVRPIPDSRLSAAGRAKLTRPLTAADTTMWLDGSAPVVSGVYGKMLKVGTEIMGFGSYTQVGTEWQVTGLTRAQWGTTAAAGATGATTSRIIVNQYGGPIGGLGIIDEISTRFGTIWNTTGIRANSFDGLEACFESGWGDYGLARLVNGSYAKTTRKDGHVTETSRMGTNIWDALTRASWGEVASTSMNQVFNNNGFYQVNHLPGMLGWIRLGGSDTLISVENKLARGAGLNAGGGYQTSISSLANGGANALTLLDAVKQWETARNLGAFTEAQKARFRDQTTNWHLTVVTAGKTWSLQQLTAAGAPIGAAETVSVPTPKLLTTPMPVGFVGKYYQGKAVSNTPATIRWAVTSGALPAGLTLNKDTGGVVGTPTTAGTSTFTVTATNKSGQANATATYSVTVN